MNFESIGEEVWYCGCGGMNSPYRDRCGACDKVRVKKEDRLNLNDGIK